MKRVASEVRKARSRTSPSRSADTGTTSQRCHVLLSEILAEDKRRWNSTLKMNLPVLRLASIRNN
jgi:hypothetical protein